MTRSERRREQKKYEKDFAAFCKITKQYIPELIQWLQELKDPRKFWTYEIEVMLMTVIMKSHYLLTQIADILLQLYEKGSPGLREAKRTIKNISSDLLKSFGKKLSSEDILFIETHGYVKAVV